MLPFLFSMIRRPPRSTLFPTRRSSDLTRVRATAGTAFREPTFAENYSVGFFPGNPDLQPERTRSVDGGIDQDRKSTRLNSSHSQISYAVFCLKKKKKKKTPNT